MTHLLKQISETITETQQNTCNKKVHVKLPKENEMSMVRVVQHKDVR